MKKDIELIKHIVCLLDKDITLTSEIREVLEEALRALQQPRTFTRDQIIELVKILVTLLSVAHYHT